MDLENIHLQETSYGKGFKGTLYDLLRDVFYKAQEVPEAEFEGCEYSKISIDSITIKA